MEVQKITIRADALSLSLSQCLVLTGYYGSRRNCYGVYTHTCISVNLLHSAINQIKKSIEVTEISFNTFLMGNC